MHEDILGIMIAYMRCDILRRVMLTSTPRALFKESKEEKCVLEIQVK